MQKDKHMLGVKGLAQLVDRENNTRFSEYIVLKSPYWTLKLNGIIQQNTI